MDRWLFKVLFAARQTERFHAAVLSKRVPRRVHASRRQTGQFAARAVRECGLDHASDRDVPFCWVWRSGGGKRFGLSLLRRLAEVKPHWRNPFLVPRCHARVGMGSIGHPCTRHGGGDRAQRWHSHSALRATRSEPQKLDSFFSFFFPSLRSWHLSHPDLHVRPHQGLSGILGRCFL